MLRRYLPVNTLRKTVSVAMSIEAPLHMMAAIQPRVEEPVMLDIEKIPYIPTSRLPTIDIAAATAMMKSRETSALINVLYMEHAMQNGIDLRDSKERAAFEETIASYHGDDEACDTQLRSRHKYAARDYVIQFDKKFKTDSF